jgi:hypothetical protein
MKKQLLLMIALLATTGIIYGVSFDYTRTKFQDIPANPAAAGLKVGDPFTVTNIDPKALSPQDLTDAAGNVWAKKTAAYYPYAGTTTPKPGTATFKVIAVPSNLAPSVTPTPGTAPKIAPPTPGTVGFKIPTITPPAKKEDVLKVLKKHLSKNQFEAIEQSLKTGLPLTKEEVEKIETILKSAPLTKDEVIAIQKVLPDIVLSMPKLKEKPTVTERVAIEEEIPVPTPKKAEVFLPGYTKPTEQVAVIEDVSVPPQRTKYIAPPTERKAVQEAIVGAVPQKPTRGIVSPTIEKLKEAAKRASETIAKMGQMNFFGKAVVDADIEAVKNSLASADPEEIRQKRDLALVNKELAPETDTVTRQKYQEIADLLEEKLAGVNPFGKAIATANVEQVEKLLPTISEGDLVLNKILVEINIDKEQPAAQKAKYSRILSLFEQEIKRREAMKKMASMDLLGTAVVEANFEQVAKLLPQATPDEIRKKRDLARLNSGRTDIDNRKREKYQQIAKLLDDEYKKR